MLARKMMKKQGDPRSMLMTSSTKLPKVTPDAAAPDVALPAGYTLK